MNEIERAVETRMIGPARRVGYELPIIGTTEEPRGEVQWQAPSGRWWLFRDHQTDPSAGLYGGVVVPNEQREKLKELLRQGFSADLILVGHELPLGYSPGDVIPDVVPQRHPLATTSGQVWKVGRPAIPSANGALTIRRAVLKVTAGLIAGAAVLGAAIGSLDPVVIAGVRSPSGAVTWVEVTRWNW
jgi:hypothetical protein